MQMFAKKKTQLSAHLLAIAAIVLSPAAANAATAGDISPVQVLNTSPVYGDGQSFHTCNVVNVSTATISVVVELINSNGGVLTSETLGIGPGTSRELSFSGGGYTGFARCRFTLNYSATTIRANVATFHSPDGGTTFQTYAFSEAR
jgi:hypothetical protein